MCYRRVTVLNHLSRLKVEVPLKLVLNINSLFLFSFLIFLSNSSYSQVQQTMSSLLLDLYILLSTLRVHQGRLSLYLVVQVAPLEKPGE